MNLNKNNLDRKQRALESKLPKVRKKLSVILFKYILVAFLALLVLGAGVAFGMVRSIIDNAPDIDPADVEPKGFSTTI